MSLIDELRADSDTFTSFPVESAQDEFAVINAMASADESGKESINKVLCVTGVVIGRDMRRNEETGELTPTRKTVLLLEDGSTVCTTGVYVPKFFGALWLRYGHKRWVPPIKVVLELKHIGQDRDCIKPKLAEAYIPAVAVPGHEKCNAHPKEKAARK